MQALFIGLAAISLRPQAVFSPCCSLNVAVLLPASAAERPCQVYMPKFSAKGHQKPTEVWPDYPRNALNMKALKV